jgi:RNA polymerase sigma-70 factor (ECF subfamily)
VLLNRAVATRFAIGPRQALAEVEPLADELDGYRLFHAVRAELLADLGRHDEARAAARDALAVYDRKEHLVGAAAMRERLAALGA